MKNYTPYFSNMFKPKFFTTLKNLEKLRNEEKNFMALNFIFSITTTISAAGCYFLEYYIPCVGFMSSLPVFLGIHIKSFRNLKHLNDEIKKK